MRKMKMNKKTDRIAALLGGVSFLFGVISVFYYIWSPLFTAEFQSDTAEMLLWAQQILEKHTLISPDFSYSYTIPFGGQLVLVPFIRLFGVRPFSLRAGMSVIALAFILVFYLFFRELFGKKYAAPGSGIMLLMLCGVRSMRELFWAHMVFYSLAVFYLLTVSILLKKLISGENSRKKRIILSAGVFLLTLLACTTGSPLLIYFAVPLLGSAILCFIIDRQKAGSAKVYDRSAWTVLIILVTAIILGFALSFAFHGDPSDEYSSYYTVLDIAENWAGNAGQFITRWIALFTELNSEPVSLFSLEGIRMSFLILTALSVLGLDTAALFSVNQLQPFERFAVLFHWILCAVLLFFFVFGTISNYERRLIPLFVTGMVSAMIMIRHLAQREGLIRGICAAAMALMLFLTALIDGAALFAIVPDNSLWRGEDSVTQILLSNHLSYGYSTDFWMSNAVTVMTGEQVRVREVWTDEDGSLIQRKNQTDRNWYRDIPGQENYFLVCQEWFIDEHPEYLEKASEVFRSEFFHPVSGKYLGYYILVYDENILKKQ